MAEQKDATAVLSRTEEALSAAVARLERVGVPEDELTLFRLTARDAREWLEGRK